jgi:hypothetical protein
VLSFPLKEQLRLGKIALLISSETEIHPTTSGRFHYIIDVDIMDNNASKKQMPETQ